MVEDLRDAITSGRLKPGDPLPSEQELDTYGLPAITITLRKLRQERLIQHRPGPGIAAPSSDSWCGDRKGPPHCSPVDVVSAERWQVSPGSREP
ncbi:GntR family transcriptional regulator [Nonomuraea angiospora]|uniref:GntR family transcriptional regulator n=1 Tax=Nonomuraea angiospora TaxID=46172 RepID=UPI003327380A